MIPFATHEQFSNYLDSFLKQVAIDTGLTPSPHANMLQFVIGLGAGIGPKNHYERPPLSMTFRSHPESPMKTIIQLTEPDATRQHAQCITSYFNQGHKADIAIVVELPYLKGKHPTIEILSGALCEEIKTAIEYQEIFRGSLLNGKKLFAELPIKKSTKAELAAVGANITLTPSQKAGIHNHVLEFTGISDDAQADILHAINVTYGEGSVHYV